MRRRGQAELAADVAHEVFEADRGHLVITLEAIPDGGERADIRWSVRVSNEALGEVAKGMIQYAMEQLGDRELPTPMSAPVRA